MTALGLEKKEGRRSHRERRSIRALEGVPPLGVKKPSSKEGEE